MSIQSETETVDHLRSNRLAARGVSVWLLTAGAILIIAAMPTRPPGELAFDTGLAAMVAGTVMALGVLLTRNQETILVRIVMETDQATSELQCRLAAVEVFERRQVEVLATALDEITPRIYRNYN